MNLRKKRLEDAIDSILAAMASWINRRQQEVITYLLAENEILKEQLNTKGQKLKLSNHQRRKLAKQGKRLGRRRLKEYASIATPQQNGFAERFVKSIKTECLNNLIFFGGNSLRRAVSEYVEHYHHERNHQSLGNLIPFPYAPINEGKNGSIVKTERLGGLLNYYSRGFESSKSREEALTG